MTENRFVATYRLIRAIRNEGVVVRQTSGVFHFASPTNDTNVIFTDLFERHRGAQLLGLEILGVFPIDDFRPQARPDDGVSLSLISN